MPDGYHQQTTAEEVLNDYPQSGWRGSCGGDENGSLGGIALRSSPEPAVAHQRRSGCRVEGAFRRRRQKGSPCGGCMNQFQASGSRSTPAPVSLPATGPWPCTGCVGRLVSLLKRSAGGQDGQRGPAKAVPRTHFTDMPVNPARLAAVASPDYRADQGSVGTIAVNPRARSVRLRAAEKMREAS